MDRTWERTAGMTGIGVLLVGLGVSLGVIWSQNRCYRRYQRLCHQWFSGDPGGELECLERADDVCFH